MSDAILSPEKGPNPGDSLPNGDKTTAAEAREIGEARSDSEKKLRDGLDNKIKKTVSVMIWNLDPGKELNAKDTKAVVRETLLNTPGYDVRMLQEIIWVPGNLKKHVGDGIDTQVEVMAGMKFYFGGETNNKDTSLMIHEDHEVQLLQSEWINFVGSGTGDGFMGKRVFVACIKFKDSKFQSLFASAHLPYIGFNEDARKTNTEKLLQKLCRFAEDRCLPLVVGGDFNTKIWEVELPLGCTCPCITDDSIDGVFTFASSESKSSLSYPKVDLFDWEKNCAEGTEERNNMFNKTGLTSKKIQEVYEKGGCHVPIVFSIQFNEPEIKSTISTLDFNKINIEDRNN